MSSTALFISHRAKPGKRDELKAVWLKHMAPAITANPGHLAYVYSYDATDEHVVHAFQHYASAAAAAEFLKNPSYLAYLEESRRLLEHEPEIKVLAPQWSKEARASQS